MKRVLILLFILIIPFYIHVRGEEKPFVVVIDAGHGGHDPGAVSGKIQEKNIALSVALKTGGLIEKNCKNVKVVYTRKTDVFVELGDRAAKANNSQADFFISIHCNAASNKSARGVETLVMSVSEEEIKLNKAAIERDGKENFELWQEYNYEAGSHLASLVQDHIIKESGIRQIDRSVRQRDKRTAVLFGTTMPSILIELGFLSNTEERAYLSSAKGMESLANAIYHAFDAYLAELRVQSSKISTSADPVKGNMPKESGSKKSQEKSDAVKKNSSNNGNAKEPAKKTVVQEEKKETGAGKPVFKVQFMVSSSNIPLTDNRFNGMKGVEVIKDNSLYKYMCGSTTDYAEAKKTREQVAGKYSDAFIVAFMNGEKIGVQEAVKMSPE